MCDFTLSQAQPKLEPDVKQEDSLPPRAGGFYSTAMHNYRLSRPLAQPIPDSWYFTSPQPQPQPQQTEKQDSEEEDSLPPRAGGFYSTAMQNYYVSRLA